MLKQFKLFTKTVIETRLGRLIDINILCELADFRDENKLVSKLFSTTALVVGKLMVSAKMQITSIIKEVLVGKVIIDKEGVKDSGVVVIVMLVVVVIVIVVVVVVMIVLVVVIVVVVVVILVVVIVMIKVAVIVMVVIKAINGVINYVLLRKSVTAIYIKKNLFHTFF